MKPAKPQTPAARTLADVGERAFLRSLRAQTLAEGSPALTLGIGDDAALLQDRALARGLVVTADALVEGVHFRRDWISPADLGRKALAVNLSDLAAMGARPLAALLTLSVPGATPLAELRGFFRGLRAACKAWACPLVGGDLTGGAHWTLSITALGTPYSSGRVLRRDAARPGDWVYVTGWPGESGAGLSALRRGITAPALIRRHHRPTPRLAEGAFLAGLPRVALLDISDGVFNDASQLADASGLAISLHPADQLPLSRPLRAFAAKHGPPRAALDFFLYGGEDYELLFATSTPPALLAAKWQAARLPTPLHCIGRTQAGQGVWLDGERLGRDGGDLTYRHFQ